MRSRQRVGETSERQERPRDGTRDARQHSERQTESGASVEQRQHRPEPDREAQVVGDAPGEQPHAERHREPRRRRPCRREREHPRGDQREQHARRDGRERQHHAHSQQRPQRGREQRVARQVVPVHGVPAVVAQRKAHAREQFAAVRRGGEVPSRGADDEIGEREHRGKSQREDPRRRAIGGALGSVGRPTSRRACGQCGRGHAKTLPTRR